jgi:hypothetical protein
MLLPEYEMKSRLKKDEILTRESTAQDDTLGVKFSRSILQFKEDNETSPIKNVSCYLRRGSG